jgi:hypothetical protein
MTAGSPSGPQRRDRTLARVRVLNWGLGLGAVAAAGGLSVAAAQSFKGHTGATTATTAATRPVTRVRVPPPQHVPAISGQPAPLLPPAQPPAAAPATQDPGGGAPPVSGGS